MNAPDPQPVAPQPVSPAKRWLIAARPFSFPASVMPVLFGTALAATVGGAAFQPVAFALALLAMVCLHAGANILGDVSDFRRGLDKVPTPVSGAIVRGLMTPETARAGAVTLIVAGSLMGLALVVRTGPALLWIGIAGVAIGVFYTLPPFALKYRALGDLAVFLGFGILGTLGGWTAQAGHLSLLPVIWGIPLSLLVVGIVHANNWRDIRTDTAKGCVTVASMLGDERSALYHQVLIFLPFVLIGLFVTAPRLLHRGVAMSPSFAITVLALPFAWRLRERGRQRKTAARALAFLTLDGATAKLTLLFGALCTSALLLDALLPGVFPLFLSERA